MTLRRDESGQGRYTSCSIGSLGDDFPAVYVGWDDAVVFCQTLTALERETGRLAATQSYRLPTEAEWEYGCRAGTTTAYSFGDKETLLKDYGWYGDNSGGRLHRVAEKKPNPRGLCDIHGNVFEWCVDWYDGPYVVGSYRVTRGGHWFEDASSCRSDYRSFDGPRDRVDGNGFRVVVLR